MKREQLDYYFNEFDKERMNVVNDTQNSHRYNSFDFCFNYFSSFEDKTHLANSNNIETSCLQLGFYLPSWGMLRGSSELLDKSLSFYIPLIETISVCDNSIWAIDVNNYGDEIIRQNLIEIYNKLSKHIPNKSTLTLVTKIMLGVFGNVPAFDRYFKIAMKNLTNQECGFTVFNHNSLSTIYKFYSCNNQIIDSLANKTKTNVFGYSRLLQGQNFTKAKVIDIIGFQFGQKISE